MARGFNLTAEINLRGPSNIRTVVADIRRQLGTITANVDIRVNQGTATNINGIAQSLVRLNTALRDTSQLANQTTNALNNLANAGRQVSTSVANLPRTLQNSAAAVSQLNARTNQTAQAVQRARTEFEEFGRQSALAVRRFAAFSLAAGAIYKVSNAISSASSEFLSFNRELVRVAQVTDTSVENLGGLVKEITGLSTGFGVTSQELIKVSSTLAQAGLNARDTERALKALALSALAPSFDDLNNTVEGSIALMRQFNIGAGDLEKALGAINAVSAKFAVESSDIITAIQRTGGVFASASRGVSEGIDSLNQFIAVFTSIRATTRESAETIATGLRTIFARIQRGDTIDALKEFGVTLTDLQGKFVGPYEAVRRLSEGLNQLDPRDLKFSRIVEELGGFRQIGKVIPLIQQFATAQQALSVAQKGQGSLTNDAATAQQALAIRITKVREEFIALIRSIGQSSSFQNFVKLSLDLASALIKVADSAKGVLPALTAIAAIRGASFLTQFGRGFVGGIRNRQNSGGPVRGFAGGGLVPGQGDSDSVSAMLTPGEYVIRKKAVETIGVSNLHRMNKYADGGTVQRFANGKGVKKFNVSAMPANPEATMIQNMVGPSGSYRFGVAALRSGGPRVKTFLQTSVNLDKEGKRQIPVEIHVGALSNRPDADDSKSIESDITSSLRRTIGTTAIKLARLFNAGIQPISGAGRTTVLQGTTLSSAVGSIFEGALGLLGAPYIDKPESIKSMDFPFGMGPKLANSFFGDASLGSIPTDVTRTYGGAGKNASDFKKQIARFYKAVEGKKYSQALVKYGKNTAPTSGTASKLFRAALTRDDISAINTLLREAGIQGNLTSRTPEASRRAIEMGLADPRNQRTAASIENMIAGRPGLVQTTRSKPAKRKALGGSIEDSVPALLTPGEFVINKNAAQRIGSARLHQLNNADKIHGFNKGGSVGGIQKLNTGGFPDPALNAQARAIAADLMRTAGLSAKDALTQARQQVSASVPAPTSGQSVSGTPVTRTPSGTKLDKFQIASNVFGLPTVPTEDAQQARLQRRAAARGANISATPGSSYAAIASSAGTSNNITLSANQVKAALASAAKSSSQSAGFFDKLKSSASSVSSSIGGALNKLRGSGATLSQDAIQARAAKRQQLAQAGLGIAFAAPMIGEQISAAMGKDSIRGAGISSAATTFGTFAGVGAQLGPWGAIVGGIAGVVMALDGFGNAMKEKEKELNNTKIESQSKTADEYLEKLSKNPQNEALTKAIEQNINTIGDAEAQNVKLSMEQRKPTFLQTVGSYASLGFYRPEEKTAEKIGQENVAMNKAGADKAMQLLTLKVNSGMGFDAAVGSLSPNIKRQIAEGVSEGPFAARNARLLAQKEKFEGKTDPYSKERVAELDRALEDNAQAAFESATQALKASDADIQRAKAAKKVAQALNIASVSIDRTFTNMENAINAAQSSLSSVSDRLDAMGSNKLAKATFAQQNVLDNPYAYSKAERASAVKQASGFFGKDAEFVSKLTEVGSNIKDTMASMAVEAQQTGKSKEVVAEDIQRTVDKQLRAAFGDNNLSRQISDQLKIALEKQLSNKETKEIDLDQIMAETTGLSNLIQSEQKAFKALSDAAKLAADSLNLYKDQLDKAISMQNEADNIRSESIGVRASNKFKLTELLGGKVKLSDRFDARTQEGASRAGVKPNEFNLNGLLNRLTSLRASRDIQQKDKERFEKNNQFTDPKTQEGLRQFTNNLSQLNNSINKTEDAIMRLPKDLQGFMDDTFNQMQQKIGELEARQQAGASFAEKLATSTPEELTDLNNTYNLVTNTLNGQIRTIQQSAAAQQAFNKVINDGGNSTEAMTAAQSAFANENKAAFGMFSELLSISGLDKQQANSMRADFLTNMAKSQGLNVQNSPFFNQLITALRQKPEDDPQIKALRDLINDLMTRQAAATEAAANLQTDKAKALMDEASKSITAAIENARIKFDEQQLQSMGLGISRPADVMNKSNGGMVYASSGKFIPRGTDTVPAMLTPGEFVVNARSASSNLPLLNAINKSQGGVVQYLSDGALVDDKVRQSLASSGLTAREYYLRTVAAMNDGSSNITQNNPYFQSLRRLAGFNELGEEISFSVSGNLSPQQVQDQLDQYSNQVNRLNQGAPGNFAARGRRSGILPNNATFGERFSAGLGDTIESLDQMFGGARDRLGGMFGGIRRGIGGAMSNIGGFFGDMARYSNAPFADMSEEALAGGSRIYRNVVRALRGGAFAGVSTFSGVSSLLGRSNIGSAVSSMGAGMAIDFALQQAGASDTARDFARAGIDFGSVIYGGTRPNSGGLSAAAQARIYAELIIQSGYEVAHAFMDRQSYINEKIQQGDEQLRAREEYGFFGGLGSNILGNIFGTDASVYKPSTWIPGRGIPSAIGRASVNSIEAYKAEAESQANEQKTMDMLGRQRYFSIDGEGYSAMGGRVQQDPSNKNILVDTVTGQRYDVTNPEERTKFQKLVSTDRLSGIADASLPGYLESYTANERNWIRAKARIEEAKQRGKVIVVDPKTGISKEIDLYEADGVTPIMAAQNLYNQQLQNLEDHKNGREVTTRGYLWNTTNRERNFSFVNSDAALQAAIPMEVEGIKADRALAEQKKKDEEARQQAQTQAQAQQAQNTASSWMSIGRAVASNAPALFNTAVSAVTGLYGTAQRKKAEKEAMDQKIRDDAQAANYYLGHPATPKMIEENKKLGEQRAAKMRELADVNEKNYLRDFAPFGEAEVHTKDEKSQAEIKAQRERERILKEVAAIDAQIADSNRAATAGMTFDEREALWANYRKEQNKKEVEKFKAAKLEQNAKLQREIDLRETLAKATGIPVPRDITRQADWRAKVLAKIEKKFFLSGKTENDKQLLQAYGMTPDMTDLLFNPMNDAQRQASYYIMASQTKGQSFKYSDEDLKLLNMNEEQIVKQRELASRQYGGLDVAMAQKNEKRRQELERAREKVFGKAVKDMDKFDVLAQRGERASRGVRSTIQRNLFKRLAKEGYIDPALGAAGNAQRLSSLGLDDQTVRFLYPNQVGGAAAIMNAQRRANGGLIYAASGRLINFQPKGTDTVPAMLTPGEFVVNAAATKENLPLLQAINKQKGGRIGYYDVGGTVESSEIRKEQSLYNQQNQAINMMNSHNSLIDKKISNIDSTGSVLKQNITTNFNNTDKSLGILQNTANKTLDSTQTTNKNFKNLGYFSTGGMVYAAAGTLIPYKPRGTDTVPAMLTPGEFVVNRQSTAANLPLLQAINNGTQSFSAGGRVNYMAGGGLLGQIFAPITTSILLLNTAIQQTVKSIQDYQKQLASTESNSVSTSGRPSPTSGLDGLGQFISKFEQFINAVNSINLPPTITLQVAPVQVNITGAEALTVALQGPMGDMLQTQITQAFGRLSAATEGAFKV